MKVGKIQTLGARIKESQRAARHAQKIASEQRLNKIVQDAAKSVFPYGKINLTVSNASDEFSTINKIYSKASLMDFSDSQWAPWLRKK